MPVSLEQEGQNVYRLEMSGVLRKADLDRSQVELAEEMRRVGAVKLLCVLKEFEGWEQNAGWNDLTFYVKHGGAIDRIAIVGEERWRAEALMFAAAGLRRGPVQYFQGPDLAAARTWLAA
jgi:hypothetical protein